MAGASIPELSAAVGYYGGQWAELADRAGVSRQTINAIESNKYVPSTILALKIARVFDKPVEQVFRLEKND